MLKLSALCPKGDRENAIMSNKAQLTDLPFRQKCQITKKPFAMTEIRSLQLRNILSIFAPKITMLGIKF